MTTAGLLIDYSIINNIQIDANLVYIPRDMK